MPSAGDLSRSLVDAAAEATTPSAILSAAADLIRDTAAASEDQAWWFDATLGYVRDRNGDLVAEVSPGEGRWVALMSPAVSPMIESWLRETASYFDEFGEYWVVVPEQARNALDFAKKVLGVQEEVSDGR